MERKSFVTISKMDYKKDSSNVYFKVVLGTRNPGVTDINLRKRHLCTLILNKRSKKFTLMEKEDEYSYYRKKQLLSVLQNQKFIGILKKFKTDSKIAMETAYLSTSASIDEAIDDLTDVWKRG